MDTGRLFLRNLAYTCTEDDLRLVFAPFGPLAEVQLPIDRETKKSKGFAYITYVMPEHAVKAYQAMDRQSLQGRILHVLPAKEKPRPAASDETLSVKKAREKKRKAQAGSDFNWNTLYMNVSSVV
jgi:multiple RNA-binding domain-containing protein 1